MLRLITPRHIIGQCAALLVASVVLATPARAQQAFKSPAEAVETLVDAVRANAFKRILTVLGRDSADILSSGDDVADDETRRRFLAAYDAGHRLKQEGDDKATVLLGKDDYPFPIPLLRRDEKWRFDTAAGRQEILYRRIGRNELAAILVSLAYVDAQNEYAEKDRTGAGAGIYAQRVVSRLGLKDGLYWSSPSGNDDSPLGELVAKASSQGYNVGGVREPFHGYYYKILTRQGANARGGELDYVVRGKMIGGFALVAYPAEYGNSGVMTFIVNHDGTVYEKDLGPRTAGIAGRMWTFNPDQTWKKAAVPSEPL